MPVLLLSLCSLIPSDVSAPFADLSELERSLLDSELALEISLRLAGAVSTKEPKNLLYISSLFYLSMKFSLNYF